MFDYEKAEMGEYKGTMNLPLNVFIVYCHPSNDSFTYQIKESFIKGLNAAGHNYVVSDLYAMNFNPVFTEEEYKREAFYNLELPVKKEILIEQEKINQSDVIVFIYPDFWTSSPAMLEGWFQRILTYGYAYGPDPSMKVLDKAMFLITMGGSMKDEIRQKQLEAMEIVMAGDRIHNRAKKCEVFVFDEMTRGYGNDEHRNENAKKFADEAYHIALDL